MGQRHRHLTKEQLQMASKHTERCSTSDVVRECNHNKETPPHAYQNGPAPEPDHSECWEGAEPEELSLLAGVRTVRMLWETVCGFLKKLNILSPHDLALVLPGIYPKELKTYVHTKPASGCL